MELLASKLRPVKHNLRDFFEAFSAFAKDAELIRISSGFVSINSVLWLKENIETSRLPATRLTVGMHAFERFTRPQYEAVMNLATTLKASGRGAVRICIAFPFHGKLYTFWKRESIFAAILGSSNLSSLDPEKGRIFEVDLAVIEGELLQKAQELQLQIDNIATRLILDWVPGDFREGPGPIAFLPDVQKVSDADFKRAKASANNEFRLELKTTPKSNLNVYFGEGRINTKTGLVRPRPWYEVEVIVSSEITGLPGYPFKKEFRVVTDDGWTFFCKTSGDNSKNFRSQGGLVVLGAWIKGRLEAAGILKVGEQITESHLKRYGRNCLTLKATGQDDVYYLSFDPHEK